MKLRAEVLALRLRLGLQLIPHEDQLLFFLVLAQSVEALFEYGAVDLVLVAEGTDGNVVQVLLALQGNAQLSHHPLFQRKVVVLGGRGPRAPGIEHAHSLLIHGSENSHTMQACMIIL